MEYLEDNLDWLVEELEDFGDDEYFLFDCPGQIELYVHHPVMRKVVETLQVNLGMRVCGIFCIESTFIKDS